MKLDQYTVDLSRWPYPARQIRTDELDRIAEQELLLLSHNGNLIPVLAFNRGHSTSVFMFHGAQKRGEGIRPPFFEGARLAQQINANVFLICDPSLILNDRLALGWYAGCAQFPCQAALTDLFRKILSISGSKRSVGFGSSGGGFAALYYGAQTPFDHVVTVNPQTRISLYVESIVRSYCMRSWGASNLPQSGFEPLFDEVGITHSVCDLYTQISRWPQITYLQNKKDWHVGKHMKPFLRALEKTALSSDHINVTLGDWGDGHARAPLPVILEALNNAL